jgi:hypothetical protein
MKDRNVDALVCARLFVGSELLLLWLDSARTGGSKHVNFNDNEEVAVKKNQQQGRCLSQMYKADVEYPPRLGFSKSGTS